MLDNDDNTTTSQNPAAAAASGSAGTDNAAQSGDAAAPVKKPARKAPAKRAPRTAKPAAQPSEAPALAAEPLAARPETGGTDTAATATDTPVTETDVADKPKRAPRARKSTARKAAAPELTATAAAAWPADEAGGDAQPDHGETAAAAAEVIEQPAKRSPRRRGSKAATPAAQPTLGAADGPTASGAEGSDDIRVEDGGGTAAPTLAPPIVLFQPPSETKPATRRRRASKATSAEPADAAGQSDAAQVAGDQGTGGRPGTATAPSTDNSDNTDIDADADTDTEGDTDSDADSGEGSGSGRRRRRRGRRGRGSRTADSDADDNPTDGGTADQDTDDDDAADDTDDDSAEVDHAEEVAEAALSASARRRRRRRRSGGAEAADGNSEDDPPNTVVHVRETRSNGRGASRDNEADSDGVRGVKGSTRLEAKRQRRRDNRDTGRRRAPILTEAEFLARREAVNRVMAVRQTGDRTQIAVLEDDILVEHYVTRASSASAVGNVYLGRVQNVLPSMEAAFVDIGRGRNGVLYAGEVNWDAAGLEGKSRAIENAMSSGDAVLVQVTKDPIGHKGARLTSQISLPGRFVVYVPGGGMTGISRKLPDVERSRLKAILKKVVPDDAGVIVRTAAEGASEADLVSDVERLKSQWESIQAKAAKPGNGPSLVYGEPDLAIRVVRDVFNDDFSKLVVAGSDIRTTITDYVGDVAPDLADRISLHTGESDLFADLRVDEQLAKALDRKVWLPSGGSLVIDRTEAMVVIDVNTGKYTGSGGNLEQTVTRNNLEAAEEIVRQLRLRDIGGIVVIDFIDMVLESNRDLVLRRLTECLGRDRTKHQVAEVTSLGLVQMTRKRVGEGLLEAFSEPCEHCKGRGVIVHTEPVDRKQSTNGAPAPAEDDRPARGKRTRKTKVAAGPEPLDDAARAAEAEKRRAAASAIAAIAAATAHHDDVDGGADQPHGGSLNIGSGPAGPAVDTPLAEAATAEAITLVSAGITGTAPAITGDGFDGTPVEQQDGDADQAPALQSGVVLNPAPVLPPRPRRRRAASRPAGPPAAVATQSDSSGQS